MIEVCMAVYTFINIPGLTEILTHSRNYSELKEVWAKWRNVSGRLMKNDYANFVELSNKAVKLLGMKFP